MSTQTTEQELIPGWRVRVDGEDIPDEVAANVLTVEVEQYINGSDLFDITVNIWDAGNQDYQYIDDETFSEGSSLEVLVGYGEDFVSLINGEVVAIEVEYGSDMAPILHVQGYDKLHRFRRGRKTQTYTNIKDSEIAEQIASAMQLQSSVDDSEIVYPHLFQYNQSDIDFLQERARRINYEVDVVDNTLQFRKAAFSESAVTTLNYRVDLKELNLRLSTLSQVKKVLVKGWNISSKEAIVGLGQSGDELGVMGGASLGADVAGDAFGEYEEVIVDKPIYEQSEADQIAKAIFNRMNLQYIRAEGESIGNASLKAGDVLELRNLGQRMSGLYYLAKTHHIIDGEGYITRFNCQRNSTS